MVKDVPANIVAPTRRLRVAQVVTRMDVGGVPDHIMTLVRGLNDTVDITIVCNAIDPQHQRELDALGIPITLLPMQRLLAPRGDIRGLAGLVRLFRREKFDVVHTHMSKAALLGGIASKWAGVPVTINTAHNLGSLAMPSAIMRGMFRVYDTTLLRLTTDAVITVSDRVRDGILSKRIVAAGKITAIHNGIDIMRFDVDPTLSRVIRQEFARADSDVLVITVARLVWFKGLKTLIASAAEVLRTCPQARFVIVGDGPQREELTKQADDLGIGDRVHFAGERRDVPGLLAASDIFVLSSVSEGLPVSILEAMASAVPVVASNVGGIPELVDDGRTGIIVPAQDVKALAAAVGRLVSKPEQRSAMGAAGRARAQKHFSTHQMVERTAALYERLMHARHPAETAKRSGHGV